MADLFCARALSSKNGCFQQELFSCSTGNFNGRKHVAKMKLLVL